MSPLSFQRQMENIAAKAGARGRLLIRRLDRHVGQSIRFGSITTGAPGQPVKTGALLASWHREVIGPYTTRWISYIPYARIIEDNLRGAQLRSKVGGFHSVKLTRAAWRFMVNYEMGQLDSMAAGVRFDFGVQRWRDDYGRFTKGPL